MTQMTLTNRMLTTVTAGNVKLLVAADRIGTGLVQAADHPPATFLSRGQFPLPRLPEPEQPARHRQEAADLWSMPSAMMPSPRSSTGSVFGPTVFRPKSGSAGLGSRGRYPGFTATTFRVGSDCQSPDRTVSGVDRDANPKPDSRRVAAAAAEAAK